MKRSLEKYGDASQQVLYVCSQACVSVSGRVCCSAASSAFYPEPLSSHKKHGWIQLSAPQAYKTSMNVRIGAIL